MQDEGRKRPLRRLEQPKSKGIAGLGGLALFNGVMFRGQHGLGIALQISEDRILVRQIPKQQKALSKFFGMIPFLRGIFLMAEMTRDALNALSLSAYSVSKSKKLRNSRQTKSLEVPKNVQNETFYLALGALLLVVLIYGLVPRFFSSAIQNNSILLNLSFGLLIRYFFTLAYAMFLRLFPEIKTVFQYHAAEHLAIWTYQENKPLDLEYTRRFSIFHPQCGTIFLVILIIVYTLLQEILIGRLPYFLDSIVLLILSLGISYEAFRFLSARVDNPIASMIILPGKILQRFTTKAPRDDQRDVALLALESALAIQPRQREKKTWVVHGLHHHSQE